MLHAVECRPDGDIAPSLVPGNVGGVSPSLEGGSTPTLMWDIQQYKDEADFVWPSRATPLESSNISGVVECLMRKGSNCVWS